HHGRCGGVHRVLDPPTHHGSRSALRPEVKVKELPMKRKLSKIVNGSQRGMTLLEIMIVLAILALVMGLVIGPRVMKLFGESKVDIAKLTVQKFANEAFPQWSRSHPDKGCP